MRSGSPTGRGGAGGSGSQFLRPDRHGRVARHGSRRRPRRECPWTAMWPLASGRRGEAWPAGRDGANTPHALSRGHERRSRPRPGRSGGRSVPWGSRGQPTLPIVAVQRRPRTGRGSRPSPRKASETSGTMPSSSSGSMCWPTASGVSRRPDRTCTGTARPGAGARASARRSSSDWPSSSSSPYGVVSRLPSAGLAPPLEGHRHGSETPPASSRGRGNWRAPGAVPGW